MRSTIAVFVIAFAALGLLLGFVQSYNVVSPGTVGASAGTERFEAEALVTMAAKTSKCPVDPLAEAKPCVDWSGCDLSHTVITFKNKMGISGVNLSGANLSGTNLTNSSLSRANLTNADLSGANLSGAVLKPVPFRTYTCFNHQICKR
jgi:hypothetical protein